MSEELYTFRVMTIDLLNTRPVIHLNIWMLSLTGLATVNSVSYWSKKTFTELGRRVYMTESSQE